MKLLIVGGTFDHAGGRPSNIVYQIHVRAKLWVGDRLRQFRRNYEYDELDGVECINGGHLFWLLEEFKANKGLRYQDCQAILWMPNIDNSHEKILPELKKARPDLLLIQSKRIIEREYTDFEIIKRMLASHSALGFIITKPDDEYKFSVVDPLGNSWADKTVLADAVDVLVERVVSIGLMSRMRTTSIGPRVDFELRQDFLDVVRDLGEEFTKHVEAINPDRFLGNASTRCCHGFPSMRSDVNTVYMSKRNVDKTIISNEQFVEVTFDKDKTGVVYLGDQKPSVDTPIQLQLYNYYPNVNYIVHGHVYIPYAPYTDENIPCGFIEEFDEIVKLFPDSSQSNMVVNLKGHGCLIMANDVEFLQQHHFLSRPIMEDQQ
jgi:hypothetical protein